MARKILVDPNVCDCGDHAWAPTTRGYVALVDATDADHLRHKWTAKPGKNTVYAHRRIGRANTLLHIEVMGLVGIDHRNGDGLDNRRRNLRAASPKENGRNRVHRKKPAQSGHRGVYLRRGKYAASIWVDGKNKRLGDFHDKESAIAARLAAEQTHYGEFAPHG